MEKVSAFSSSILNITLYFQRLSYIEIFIYYVLLILSIKKNKKVLILLLIFVFILYIKPNFNKNAYVYFIDQTTPNMIQRISEIFERKPLISKEI